MIEQLLFTEKKAMAHEIRDNDADDVFQLCISTKRKQKLYNL